MKASDKIKSFIKEHEGLRLEAYRCSGGVWTIGYGHTGTDVQQGLQIDRAEAERLFGNDVARFEQELNRLLRTDGVAELTQNQFDALLDFAFNVGCAKMRSSTLWRKIKANVNDPTIPDEFKRWKYAGGSISPGLVRRRAAEAAMWKGKYA